MTTKAAVIQGIEAMDLEEFVETLFGLPFTPEFPDNHAMTETDMLGVFAATQIVHGLADVSLDDRLRAARTLGCFLPQFPRRMLFYRRYGLPLPKALEPAPVVLRFALRPVAPWLDSEDLEELGRGVAELYRRSLLQVEAHFAGDEAAEFAASMEVIEVEEALAAIYRDEVDGRRQLRFLGGLHFSEDGVL